MSFVDHVTKSRNHLIRLVTAENRGRDAWWYIRVENSKFELYKIQIETGTINLPEFGEILFKGFGKEPPEDIKKKIENGDY